MMRKIRVGSRMVMIAFQGLRSKAKPVESEAATREEVCLRSAKFKINIKVKGRSQMLAALVKTPLTINR